ncbi:PepSY domain-containing protein [Planomonospora parontospora]|uniref:PepSY domain-containing protein n=2 Tax=Planomonospora parontospora TaxID=58119 RepID=UPI001E457558|nr:PepSY domain-containing protein [Planomonospora parontospora]
MRLRKRLSEKPLPSGSGGVTKKTHLIARITLAAVGTAALLGTVAGTALASGATATATASGIATAPAVPVSCAKAVRIAKKRVPGARVSEVEREWEHGHRVCKVELEKGRWEYDVYVSQRTGKIVKFKRE